MYPARSSGKYSKLSTDDPVSGVYSTECQGQYGAKVAYIFRPSIAYATACSCAAMDSAPSGGTEGTDYLKISVYKSDNSTETKYINLKTSADSETVYVVYNVLADADIFDGITDDELDKHSGVIIFQVKFSPYGSPQEGCFYGVKFQFLTKDGQVPTKANKDSIFSKTHVYIEGGYNAGTAYNTVSSLDDAVEKFGFANGDYFASSNWTSTVSGAEWTGRAAAASGGMQGAVFTKAE